jgi:hypothetical protein
MLTGRERHKPAIEAESGSYSIKLCQTPALLTEAGVFCFGPRGLCSEEECERRP